jgi:hypothetical protein
MSRWTHGTGVMVRTLVALLEDLAS